MNSNDKVLVVGTTSDYIDWILHARPGKVLFLTDYSARKRANEPVPSRGVEVLTSLEDEDQAKRDLLHHIQRANIRLVGITCYDCESMELTASIAKDFELPYPSGDCIRLCRDKYTSKVLWQRNGVRCPQVRLVQSASDVFAFMQDTDQSCVLKPLTGSGSELVFCCTGKKDCEKWVQVMRQELTTRESHRLYAKETARFLAEEYVCGTEYSCDFIVSNEGVRVIRLTRKIHGKGRPFGTISGYALADYPAQEFSADRLEAMLFTAAQAMGIHRAICMVDFLVTDDEIVLLEITPRPGGDCIPHLLRRSGGLDILSLAIDFAAQESWHFSKHNFNGKYVGVRLHARKPGQIMKINAEHLESDPRVREINIIRKEGHRVSLPPQDYDSWYLGYVIFQPADTVSLEEQCNQIRRQLVLETTS